MLSFKYFFWFSFKYLFCSPSNSFFLSFKYFCLPSNIFCSSSKIFFYFPLNICFRFLQIFFAFLQIFFCFPSNIYIFLLSFKNFHFLPMKYILLSSNNFAFPPIFPSINFVALQKVLFFFQCFCFTSKIFILLQILLLCFKTFFFAFFLQILLLSFKTFFLCFPSLKKISMTNFYQLENQSI